MLRKYMAVFRQHQVFKASFHVMLPFHHDCAYEGSILSHISTRPGVIVLEKNTPTKNAISCSLHGG